MNNIPKEYKLRIGNRSCFHQLMGLIPRIFIFLKYSLIRNYARFNGASIGANSIIPYKLAKKSNKNLFIGDDCIIETSDIDLRGIIVIKDRVIINAHACILRASHDINSRTYATIVSDPLCISEYSWLATGAVIMPSVTNLSQGTIVGGFSVLTRNTEANGVYVGNPAVCKKQHKNVFDDMVIPSLKGGDLKYYIKSIKNEE